ncbi:MAG: RNA methyltransferase [Synechococcus sp.]
MALPDQVLLSDLLHHRVRCDQGLDHGPGVMAWMHPPVHRLLGWASRPSALRNSRDVWRLDQCRGFSGQEVFVKGPAAPTDQFTLERLPTLMDADLVDRQGARLGQIADLTFVPATGEILHYLVSRSDPRLPGSSRWRLTPDRIVDQQPGLVSTALRDLDDLPLARSSVRQDLMRQSRHWREQLQQMGDRAGERLEGWLEDPPWDRVADWSEQPSRVDDAVDSPSPDPLDGWDGPEWSQDQPPSRRPDQRPSRRSEPRSARDSDADPWV